MSTTGPVIWITRPVAVGAAVAIVGVGPPARLAPSLGAGRDLDHLAGDVCLADLVVREGEVVDQLFRVLRGALHGDHLARHLRCRGLQDGLVDPGRDVAREELAKDGRRVRLEDERSEERRVGKERRSRWWP